jgi:death-on-curing protein
MSLFLTAEQVLFIHSRLIDETGGSHGIRDLGMLLSAIGRPQATYQEKDLYPNLFMKAAALMDSLVRNHPFIDGNKRTAITSTAMFLLINGFRLEVESNKMVRFSLACAQSQLPLNEIAAWFKRFSVKV